MGRESKAFNVKVGIHQGSVPSLHCCSAVHHVGGFVFSVKEGLLMELLYADDFVLMAESNC